MNSVFELGRIFRSFRQDAGLTQQEVAERIGANRSAIALMEQGRRLLPAEWLSKSAQLLRMPHTLVQPFLSREVQSRRNRTAPKAPRIAPFSTLCLSGITGSGKTTLSQVITRNYSAHRIGSHPLGRAYIKDLANDQRRWAFEAQAAFLIAKTNEIREALSAGSSIVVERWIDEDASVYERMFEEEGAIDPRGSDTFKSLIEMSQDLLPAPEFIFYCSCSPETAHSRVHRRGRSDQPLHTLDFLRKTHQRYEQWLQSLSGPEVYIIDTESADFTLPVVMEEVLSEITFVLTNDVRSRQLDLFPDQSPSPDLTLRVVRPYRRERWKSITKTPTAQGVTPLVSPIAYLAAPFTGQDSAASSPDSNLSLFDLERGHGVIPRAGFRNHLLNIERALTKSGFVVLLPHRDVNEWGKRVLIPEQAMQACTMHVHAADLFVGILGKSCGAHYEFGLAAAAGKPCIIIMIDSLPSSFLAQGALSLESPDVLVIKCPSLADASTAMSTDSRVQQFIERHFSAAGI